MNFYKHSLTLVASNCKDTTALTSWKPAPTTECNSRRFHWGGNLFQVQVIPLTVTMTRWDVHFADQEKATEELRHLVKAAQLAKELEFELRGLLLSSTSRRHPQ